MRRDHVETLTLTAPAPHWVPPMSCANVIVTGGASIRLIDATAATRGAAPQLSMRGIR